MCLGRPIYELYEALPEQKQRQLREQYGVSAEGDQYYKLRSVLVENIEEINGSGVIQLSDTYLACVLRYRHIITLMTNFFGDMSDNKQKDTKFPLAQLRRLLRERGLLSGTDD